MRALAIVPASIFAFLAAVAACMALLHLAPSSTVLWWVNIEVFPRFRTLFYMIEWLVAPAPVMVATVLATVAMAIVFMAGQRAVTFLANHVAALAIGVSLFSPHITPVAIADPGFAGSTASILLPAVSGENAINLLLLIVCLLSCAGCHRAFLLRK